MGMGSAEFQISSGKSSAQRPEGFQFTRSRRCAKPRIFHTYTPKVYKIEPQEFLALVQKLTGQPTGSLVPSLKSQMDSSSMLSTSADNHHEREHDGAKVQSADSPLATPVSTHLLDSLPNPSLVTLNFLPILSTTPGTKPTIPSGKGKNSFVNPTWSIEY